MMIPQSDPVRRHPDGSIDFGFYGRRAAIIRRVDQRTLIARIGDRIRRVARLLSLA